ncbi:MAG: hypothetical protein IKC50_05315 [Oscillospiraceae bacterium]|nr:hypothetical protein [Oscillospiraceae bacterium]MBR2977676.1 hypothetical protein [Oscillospiraceae bacterium]
MVSYQTKNRLRRGVKIALLVLSLLLLLAIVRFIYLERFLVYDKNGVHLDLGGGVATLVDQTAAQKQEDFPLIREDASGTEVEQPQNGSLKRLSGVSVTAAQLLEEDVRGALSGYAENAILLDVKTATGKFLYPTEQAHADVSAQAGEVAALIKQLKSGHGTTRIARLPAFSDRAFALADFSHSLAIKGGALWMDANGSYWLDPASEDTQSYLIAIAKELSRLGFDEVVFDNFNFPQSTSLVYSGDGKQACRDAAAKIAEALGGTGIACSFVSDDEEILARSAHAYIPLTDNMMISSLIGEYAELFPNEASLVFLTDSRDSRLGQCSMLSPWTE